MTFLIQEMLFSDDLAPRAARVGLMCPMCGHLQDEEAQWLALRRGEHMGCGGCGLIFQIPRVEP